MVSRKLFSFDVSRAVVSYLEAAGSSETLVTTRVLLFCVALYNEIQARR
jgi:hypothetical protein